MLIYKEQIDKNNPLNYYHAVEKTVYLGDFRYRNKQFIGGTVKSSGKSTYFFSPDTQKLMHSDRNPGVAGVKVFNGLPFELNAELLPVNWAAAKGEVIREFDGIWNQQFKAYFPEGWWNDFSRSCIAAPF